MVYLLSQHAPMEDLRSFVVAAYYARPSNFGMAFGEVSGGAPVAPEHCAAADRALGCAWARVFPRFMLALPDLTCSSPAPRFHDTTLLVVVPPLRRRFWCLGAHCQCAFLASRAESSNPWRLPANVRGKELRLPAWVVKSRKGLVQAHSLPGELLPAPLRVHYRDPSAPLPLGLPLRVRKGMFRDGHRVLEGGHVSNCHVSAAGIEVFKELDSGLAGVQDLWTKLAREDSQLFGAAEGVNAGMARALALMNQCFDFSRLLLEEPTESDFDAFKELARMLLPMLRRTEWPNFPEVTRGWPRAATLDAGLGALARQYALLMRRVRQAKKVKPRLAATFWKTTGYHVCPVIVPRWLLAFVRQCCGECSNLVSSAAARISEFLLGPATVWKLSAPVLFMPGHPALSAKRIWQSSRRRWEFRLGRSPGSLCVALVPGLEGKLLRATDAVREVDLSAVSAAIDCDEYFARGLPSTAPAVPRRSAWHAVKIHNQSRTMNALEAPCERTGSLMGIIWVGKSSKLLVYF